MGSSSYVDGDTFPRQGSFLGHRAQVAFHYDLRNTLPGTVIRDDCEPPWQLVIRLDDGRVVLGQECQYAILDDVVPLD